MGGGLECAAPLTCLHDHDCLRDIVPTAVVVRDAGALLYRYFR
jgi:hypothetical protein